MGFLFILGLLLHSPAHAVPCTRVDIPIEGVQRVSFEHGSRLVRLYYRVESCGADDAVFLIESDLRDETESTQTVYRGRLETIYKPTNIEGSVFNKLPRRIQLVEDSDYSLRGAKSGELGGLRFYAEGELQLSTIDREPEVQPAAASAQRSNEISLRSKALRFAPFRQTRISVECAPNRGVRLARSQAFQVGGQNYELWTLRTREGYEMTELLELESRRSVQVAKVFVADANGKFLIGMPVVDGDYLNFEDLERDVYMPNLKLDDQLPLSKEEWLNRTPVDHYSPLAVTFNDTAESESFQAMRNLLTEVIPQDLILEEYRELLVDRKLHSVWKDGRTAYLSGIEWVRDLVYKSVPELARLSLNNSDLRQTVQAFSEGVSMLFVAGTINEAQFQELLSLPRLKEQSCMLRLKGYARQVKVQSTLQRDLTEAMRKTSLNLSILRGTLARLRNGEK